MKMFHKICDFLFGGHIEKRLFRQYVFKGNNGEIFKALIPAEIDDMVADILDDEQIIEFWERFICDYVLEEKDVDMDESFTKLVNFLKNDSFLERLNSLTDSDGKVDWKSFLCD